ncbi:hypothetical protein XANCAGTX0491_003905 [Xanthoria calcicola]
MAFSSKIVTSLAEAWLSIKVPGNDVARFAEPRLIEVMEVTATLQLLARQLAIALSSYRTLKKP